MFDPDHVAAIFGSHAEAEAAVNDLRAMGIADEHLGIAIHQEGIHVVLEEDEDADVEHAAARGIAVGGALGVVAGITVMAIASTGVGAIGVGGLLVGGLASLLGGAAIGGEVTLAAEQRLLGEVDHWTSMPLAPGEMLVVAKAHDRRDDIESQMRHHGGRILASSS